MIYFAVFIFLTQFLPMLMLLCVGVTFAALGSMFSSFTLYKYGFRIALSVDQMANTFLLGFPDESISARIGRAVQTGKPKRGVKTLEKSINFIFLKAFGSENHCQSSVEPEDNFGARYEEFKLYRE